MTTNFKETNSLGVAVDVDQIYITATELNALVDQLPATVFPGKTLWAWGNNDNGQLGNGTIIAKSSPVQVGSLTDWVMFCKKNVNAAAIRQDGTLWAWGNNDDGQLGQNDVLHRSSPVQVGSLTNWAKVFNPVGGPGMIAAINTFGELYVCGVNNRGQLGQGDITTRSAFVQVTLSNMGPVVKLALNESNYPAVSVAAIDTSGRLYTWGENTNGALGLGTIVHMSQPSQVGSLTNWADVAVGASCMLAIKTDGTLWSWGSGTSSQLGSGSLTHRSSPVQVGSLTNWKKVVASRSLAASSVAAIKTDGTLWVWGFQDMYGQLGTGNLVNYSSPVQVGTLTNWADVAVDIFETQTVAIKTDGTLWAWGNCLTGPFNTQVSYSSPVQVGSLTTWYSVASGGALKLT